jgi:RNA polymerase sigma-70 factor, ECF subfamily
MMVAPTGTQEFDGFFRVEYPKLVAVAMGLTGNHETACELAQEALLRCHRSWSRVSTMDVPGAWVRRVLINLATDLHRSRTRARRLPGWAHTTDSVAADSFADPVVDGWWTAVRALPDRQRAVVVLHYIEDRSVVDVARVLGIAEGTVKATLAKARSTLARTMTRET